MIIGRGGGHLAMSLYYSATGQESRFFSNLHTDLFSPTINRNSAFSCSVNV